MNAVCRKWGCSTLPKPSSVVMLRFCAAVTGTLHDRTVFPSMITVHAPHWPRPQPNLGPCSPRSSRKTYKSGVLGSMSTTRDWLFTRSEIRAMASFLSPGERRAGSRSGSDHLDSSVVRYYTPHRPGRECSNEVLCCARTLEKLRIEECATARALCLYPG